MATRTTTKKAELKTSTAKPATEKEAPAKKQNTVKAADKGTDKNMGGQRIIPFLSSTILSGT